ncbi:MAG: DGQHR domain-containing protein [Acidobacteria bacterium]|nr:DGQHR domain-containing protein [Acidobacteriota bacterium]
MSNQITVPGGLTGYDATDEYIAQRTVQGGRVHFTVAMPIVRIPSMLPKPDPAVPFEDNRIVNPTHAKKFADYVFEKEDWHSGPLTIRTTSDSVSFKVFETGDLGPVQLGVLSVPRSRQAAFSIVDGQHRVLGLSLLMDRLGDEIRDQNSLLQKATNNGEPATVTSQFTRELARLKLIEERINAASIVLDIVIENDDVAARQIFVDVAANALGINKSVKDRFDQRKVANRAMSEILASPPLLLQQRIEEHKSTVAGRNLNFISAAHVADIVRILTKGITGRISAANEKTLNHADLALTTEHFFDDLTTAFPDLELVAKGTLTAPKLREQSLLGSATMLRVLAGVYYNLTVSGGSRPFVIDFFRRLAPHMTAPVDSRTASGDLWLNAGSELSFVEGSMAPGARAQQVSELVDVITDWATTPPPQL